MSTSDIKHRMLRKISNVKKKSDKNFDLLNHVKMDGCKSNQITALLSSNAASQVEIDKK